MFYRERDHTEINRRDMSAQCTYCGKTWERDPRLEVPCPTCRAGVGKRCRRPSEHECSIHRSREEKAVVEGFLSRRCPGNPQHAGKREQNVHPAEEKGTQGELFARGSDEARDG